MNGFDVEIKTTPVPRLALTREEVARALSISVRTVDSLLADPDERIPHVRVVKRRLFPVDQLREWLRERAATK